jgi:hypothetical protein
VNEQVKAHEARSPADSGFTWELWCISLLAAAFVAALAALLVLVARDGEPGLPLLGGALAVILLFLKVTPWLTRKYRERQRRAFSRAAEAMTTDARPRVLYLRPFKDDESISRAVGLASVEQELCMVLRDFGPFVTFKGPRETADPGAARISVPHGCPWQEEVEEQMAGARLVVMRIGDTDGFRWEARRVAEIVRPERLVFWVPEGRGEYERFRREAEEWLPCRLPEYKVGRSPFGPHGGIVYFEPDWTPHLRKFRTVWLRQTFWNLFTATLKTGLRPVFEQLSVEWRKPPVQPIQVAYVLALVLLTALLLYYVCSLLSRLWSAL